MNGALLVDAAGAPLRPAIIWADQRATAQADFIRERCGEAEIYRLTGNRVSPAYTAAKLLWIKDNQPEIYRRIRWVLQAKDYAAFLFSGVMATDYSDASLTLLLDLTGTALVRAVAGALELDAALLPPIFPSATVIGEVTAQAAAATGLRAGTPVVIGGGDGACATVGAGSVHHGDAYNYIGSSSWVALSTRQPVLDPARRTFNFAHLDPALNVALGTMQTAGGAFDWFERLLRATVRPTRIYRGAGRGWPLRSRRAPTACSSCPTCWASAARIGIRWRAGRSLAWRCRWPRELARAVLEGVAFNLRAILESCCASRPSRSRDLEGLRAYAADRRRRQERAVAPDPGRRLRPAH